MELKLDSEDIQKIIAKHFSVEVDDVCVDTEKETVWYGLAESIQEFPVAYISNFNLENTKK